MWDLNLGKKTNNNKMCILYTSFSDILLPLAEIVELYAYRVHIAKKGGLACLEYKRQPGRR